MSHQHFMRQALNEAEKALVENEFPVGCVIARDGATIARGRRRNSTTGTFTELDHAEIVALRALQASGREVDCTKVTFYSTMEPCLMCYASLILSGITTVVYAYEDIMGGATGLSSKHLPPLYRDMQITIIPHVLRTESLALVKRFFKKPDNTYWQGSLLARYTLEQE